MTAVFIEITRARTSCYVELVFEVSVDADDGFPMYACQNCMSSANSVHDKPS